MEQLTSQDFQCLIAGFAANVIARRDELNELDGKLGDADFGTSIAGGCNALQALLPELVGLAPGMVLGKSGMTLVKSMGGASGPLFGTIFMRAGKELGNQTEAGVAELARMFNASLEGVKTLGKSDVGDKTLIDALAPAAQALSAAAARGATLAEALADACAAAGQGVEATKAMIANRGRAHYVGERGIGHQDAGATAIHLLFKVFADYAA
ncbi:dihydroxyacetone kinase subunit DhaL [Propionivibrio dicarboxylicus]|uniref:Dihydroxyacetone kinase, C-terminal domain n=1 Tax=Propionivibrio dicarboxylicus TaxID=83767 RepID=A0A1G8LIP3_9RHOO|nr:dihydroxyacetone kinase subunit DhaL [Propionivibrio dicarboxylicus]SDI55508.1 dihydroxyacetone kinase, C-terminal domain [Propionivibrio dicarboxylicus]